MTFRNDTFAREKENERLTLIFAGSSDRRLADLVMKSRDAYHSQVWGNNQHMLETARNLVVEVRVC